jgi:ERCC4-type nuclease
MEELKGLEDVFSDDDDFDPDALISTDDARVAATLAQNVHPRKSKVLRDIYVILDTREKDKRREYLLKEALNIVYPGQGRLVRKTLKSGDVAFCEGDPSTFDENTNCFPKIEIKTVNDLGSTIGSKRDEQTDVMLGFIKIPGFAIYLIEGKLEEAYKKERITSMYTRIIELVMHGKANVSNPLDRGASVVFILNVVSALEHLPAHKFKPEIAGNRIHAGPKTKKDANEHDCFLNMLLSVHGVSQRIAEQVVCRCPTLTDYYSLYFEHFRTRGNSNKQQEVAETLLSTRYPEIQKHTSKDIYIRFQPQDVYDAAATACQTKKFRSNNNTAVTMRDDE